MKTIYVWGCSDDLIEVTGDVTDEFYLPEGDSFKVLFSTGAIISGKYNDDGEWEFHEDIPGSSLVTRYRRGSPEAETHSEGRDYSDVVCVQGEIEWLTICSKVIKVK